MNTSQNEVIADPTISRQNSFIGSVTQQATSVVTNTDQNCYEDVLGCFSIYGFEYVPGFDNAVSLHLGYLVAREKTDDVHAVHHMGIE